MANVLPWLLPMELHLLTVFRLDHKPRMFLMEELPMVLIPGHFSLSQLPMQATTLLEFKPFIQAHTRISFIQILHLQAFILNQLHGLNWN